MYVESQPLSPPPPPQVFKEEEEAVKVDLHEGCGRIKLYWTMAVADYRTLKGMIEFRETAGSEYCSRGALHKVALFFFLEQVQKGHVDTVVHPTTQAYSLLAMSAPTRSARRECRTRATGPCRVVTCAVGSRERRSVSRACTAVPRRRALN